MDLSSQCYQQARREVCADMSAARAKNEDNKPDNRERDSRAWLKGTRLKRGVEGNQPEEDLSWSLHSAHQRT